MARLHAQLPRLIRNDKGATAIEYGLIACMVSVTIIAGLTILGPNLRDAFSNIGNTVAAHSTPGP